MGVLEYNGIQDDYSLTPLAITQGSLFHPCLHQSNQSLKITNPCFEFIHEGNQPLPK